MVCGICRDKQSFIPSSHNVNQIGYIKPQNMQPETDTHTHTQWQDSLVSIKYKLKTH